MNQESSGDVTAEKEHLGVISEHLVYKVVKLEMITKGVNVNRKEKQ